MKDIPKNQYLALLRGINVGGNNIIKMTDLKAHFESIGFSDVATYIQSGNVIFATDQQDPAILTAIIEKELSDRFNYQSKIVLVSKEQLDSVINEAPQGFGFEPDAYRYDVLFLMESLTPEAAMEDIILRDGVDQAYLGRNVIYFSRLISQAGQSYLNKLVGNALYKKMTIRNWNTTTKLHGMINQN